MPDPADGDADGHDEGAECGRDPDVLRQRPSYFMGSVDKALLLIQVLRDNGALRLTDAAREIGASAPATHRILSMLIYRGFAVKNYDRLYLPGSAVGAGPLGFSVAMRWLRAEAAPIMAELAASMPSLISLSVRSSRQVRFLSTAGEVNIRSSDNRGAVLPARATASGRALLSGLSVESLKALYYHPTDSGEKMSEREFLEFARELSKIRRQGYAINFDGATRGVSVLAMAIHADRHSAGAALSMTYPNADKSVALENRVATLGGAVDRLRARMEPT